MKGHCVAVIGLVGSLCLFSPAAAFVHASSRKLDPECLWQQMSPSTRSALVKSYSSGGADALDSVSIPNHAIETIARSCGIRRPDDVNLRNAGAAIAGIALQHAAGQRLLVMRAPLSRLAAVWGKTSPEQKRMILGSLTEENSTDPQSARQLFTVMIDLARKAGAPLQSGVRPLEDQTVRPYIDWFLGHAQAEHFWADRPRG